MVPQEGGSTSPPPLCMYPLTHAFTDPADIPTTPLLIALATSPDTSAPLDPAAVTATHFAAVLFSHLLRGSPRTKTLALSIMPHFQPPSTAAPDSTFFVPADGAPHPPPSSIPDPASEPDDDPPQSLLQMLTENLNLSLLSHARSKTSDRESREWDRLIVGYLALLVQWLWEEPGSVREFLNAGGLTVVRRSFFIPP